MDLHGNVLHGWVWEQVADLGSAFPGHGAMRPERQEIGFTCSMSRSGNVWINATMKSFFPSMKTERIGRETYRTRNPATEDMFD